MVDVSGSTTWEYDIRGRVAQESKLITGSNNPLWRLTDHLGSTTKLVNYNGLSDQSQELYKPWGEKRWSSGTLPTTYQYTGQRHEKDLGPS